jgi:hypothetical protein
VQRDDEKAKLLEHELAQWVQKTGWRQTTVEELQRTVESVQKTTLDRMEEVPAMLSHDRIAAGDIDGLCKHSKKTVATGPTTPM